MKVKPAIRTSSIQEYYFSKKLKQIDLMKAAGADIISLGIGSPDLAPSANTIDRLYEEARKPSSHGYQSYIGIPALRNAFADWYRKYFNVGLDPQSEILPLMGSKEGIMHISMAYVNPGDEVLVPNPGYPAYASAANLVGGVVRYYELDEKNNWHPDLEELEKSDLKNVKIMWTNYPHMPTGAGATRELFNKLVSFGKRHNILLCNDNPYSFILNNNHNSILATEGAKDIALELNSLSKSHNMAGWRIGMVAGDKEYISGILKVKSNMDSGMFLPLMAAAAEALKNPSSWYDEINSVYKKRRLIVEEIMGILNCSFDKNQTGLFLWGKIPGEVESSEMFTDEILEKAHVFVTPGSVFGSKGKRYIRISLCAREEVLEKAKKRLAEIKF
jgi:aspartate/methionine/tyrosine aminotransferase